MMGVDEQSTEREREREIVPLRVIKVP